MFNCQQLDEYEESHPAQDCLRFIEKNYQLVGKLGEGSFGIVLDLVQRQTNTELALKITLPQQIELTVSCAVTDMVRNQLTLSFISLTGWFMCEPPTNLSWQVEMESELFESSVLMYLELEKAKSSLESLVNRRASFSEQDIKSLLFELLYALYVAKSRLGLIHGDITLGNILINYRRENEPRVYRIGTQQYVISSIYLPLLSDFGLSRLNSRFQLVEDTDLFGVAASFTHLIQFGNKTVSAMFNESWPLFKALLYGYQQFNPSFLRDILLSPFFYSLQSPVIGTPIHIRPL